MRLKVTVTKNNGEVSEYIANDVKQSSLKRSIQLISGEEIEFDLSEIKKFEINKLTKSNNLESLNE